MNISRRRVSANRRLELKYPQSPIAKASDYFVHFTALIQDRPGIPRVLYCRVSGREQNRRGNLRDQSDNQHRTVGQHENSVQACYREIASGWELDDGMDRPTLAAAIATAKKIGAVLVVESTDRLIRSVEYSKKNQDVLPTVAEFDKLMRLADGVTLATLLHPDTSPGDVRSHQIKRGQRAKGHKGGRPRITKPGEKKRRREEMLPMVLHLHRVGESRREIAEWTGLPVMTISDWIRKRN